MQDCRRSNHDDPDHVQIGAFVRNTGHFHNEFHFAGGTSELAATLCLKIGKNSVAMNMLLLGEFHFEPRGRSAHCCCLCCPCEVYMVDLIVAAVQHEKIA